MSTITTARRGSAALVAGLAALAVAAAPANARPATAAPAKPNIVETAVAAGNFTTLVSLVKQAGLAETLSGTGPYTVFAPTDAAFKKVPKKTLTALGKDKAKLKAVLLYHVAAGRLAAKRVVKRSSIETLNGKRVQIRVRGRNVFVNRSKVVTADVRASNGIIHAVNRVLEVLHFYGILTLTGSYKRRFVAYIGDVRARKSGCLFSKLVNIEF